MASAQADFERCPWTLSAVTADLPYLGTWNSGRANCKTVNRSGAPYPWTGSSWGLMAWGMRWSSFYVAIRRGGRSKLGEFGPKWRPLGSGVLKAPGRLPKTWEVVQLCRPFVEKEWRLSTFPLHNCTTCQVHMFPCPKKELAIADFFAPSASLPADCRGLLVGQDSWLAAQRAAARSARPMPVRDATKSGAAAPLYLHSASRARALRQDHARRRCVSRQQHEAHAAHVAAARGRKKRARSARSSREAVQLRA